MNDKLLVAISALATALVCVSSYAVSIVYTLGPGR